MTVQMPCEVLVWKFLPAFRSAMARELKAQGKSQKEVAQILGVTPAAISQYLKEKRGNDLVFSDAIKEEIKKSAKDLNSKSNMLQVMNVACMTCSKARDDNTIWNKFKEERPDLKNAETTCNL